MANPPPLGQYATTPIYNTKAVARDTEVPADTFRAWERRYGIPRPQRTAGGHRLYSDRDIAIIRWLRDRTAEGMNISQAVMLLLNTLEQTPDVPAAPISEPRGMDRLRTELMNALLGFNSQNADHVISEAFSIHPFEEVLLQLIQPTMVEIGEMWHRGEINVGVEHFATEFVRRKLAALIGMFDGDPSWATILVACAPDELHDLGALFASLFMVRRGWHVVYLGPQVPLIDLLQTIRTVGPDVVCLSATLPDTAIQLIDVARAIQKEFPGIHVGYGGRVYNVYPEMRQPMPGVFLGQNSHEMIEQIQGMISGHRATSTAAA